MLKAECAAFPRLRAGFSRQLGAGSWEQAAESCQPDARSPYSYRSASIGSMRDALMAGKRPKKMPTLAEKPMPRANDHQGSEIGKPETQWTMTPMLLPRMMPSTPPAEVRNAASMR